MSGITGILTTQQQTISATTLQAMTAIIQHRGPDAEGYYISEQIALGYRHFDVHGLTAEQAQTMLHLDRYAVTFDGRIYNLPELQAELSEKGYSFNCESDAQLLAAAYDYWGTDCLNKLNADWAFVIYDTHTQKLFIARDRFGIKPLYYYTDGASFIFGSEIKAIYASNLVEKAPNETYLKSYLEKGPNEYDAPTAFKNIVRFPFAHYFHGTLQELLHQPTFIRYWSLQVNTAREKFDPEKAKKYAQQYYDLLADAVKLRLRADVKVGSALSGGLDSSSIVYLVNQQLKAQGKADLQETFSSVYKSDGTLDCDESHFIDLLAKELKVNSNQIEPQEKDVPAEHQKVIWAMENPPESTIMSSWHTFMKVNQTGIIVNLDGQGADEMLAGYTPYISSYFMSISLIDLYKELFHFLKFPDVRKRVIQSFCLAHFRFFFGNKIYKKLFKKLKGHNAPDQLNKVLKDSFTQGLVTLLHYADHTSMAHSVESRAPFMDYRLVEFLAQVPACYKMHNGWTKYLARLAFDKKLPDEITWRKDKMGWPIPEEYWFRGNLKGWFINTVESSSLVKELSPNTSTVKELENNEPITKLIRKLNIAVFSKIYMSDF